MYSQKYQEYTLRSFSLKEENLEPSSILEVPDLYSEITLLYY